MYLKYNREVVAVVLCLFVIAGFFLSRILVSVGMISLLVLAILPGPEGWPIQLGWRRFWGYKAFPVLTLVFFLVVIGGLYTDAANFSFFEERVRIKAPFLGLPLAFGALLAFSRSQLNTVLIFFVLLIAALSLGMLGNYLLHFEAINATLLYGKPIPAPINHIRFSLMMALAVVVGINLLARNELPNKALNWAVAGATVLLFVCIHVFTVRSGLLALYLALVYLVGVYIVRRRAFGTGTALLVALIALPIVAYQAVPSVRNKMQYALHDLRMYQQGSPIAYSDTRRLVSMEAGIAVGMQNPWIGVGTGDALQAVYDWYAEKHPEITEPTNRKLPHNQFIWVFASHGSIGLVLFVFAMFFPLFYRGNYRSPLLVSFYLITISSFMVEQTLESQFGAAFYCLFLMIILNHLKGPSEA